MADRPPARVEVARVIRTGVVHINGAPRNDEAPFGGFKASGVAVNMARSDCPNTSNSSRSLRVTSRRNALHRSLVGPDRTARRGRLLVASPARSRELRARPHGQAG